MPRGHGKKARASRGAAADRSTLVSVSSRATANIGAMSGAGKGFQRGSQITARQRGRASAIDGHGHRGILSARVRSRKLFATSERRPPNRWPCRSRGAGLWCRLGFRHRTHAVIELKAAFVGALSASDTSAHALYRGGNRRNRTTAMRIIKGHFHGPSAQYGGRGPWVAMGSKRCGSTISFLYWLARGRVQALGQVFGAVHDGVAG